MADIQISPGNTHLPSCLCPPHIRSCLPYSYWTLKIFAFSSDMTASYVIPVRRAGTLPATSFRPDLTVTALAVQLKVPAVGPTKEKARSCGNFGPLVSGLLIFFINRRRNPSRSMPRRSVGPVYDHEPVGIRGRNGPRGGL